MSSVASEDPKLKELAAIRTQGLMGMIALLLTFWTIIYHARPADPNVHQNIAADAFVGFANAKADLQNLFGPVPSERNLDLLRTYSTFGHDFVPAWMLVIMFLYRALIFSRPEMSKTYLFSGFLLIGTWLINAFVTSTLDKAAQQPAVTDAMLNAIHLQGLTKWTFFFADTFLLGLWLLMRPLIVRIGAVILVVFSVAAFICPSIPSGVYVPYFVLGLFIGLTGISLLLLFHPELLLEPRG